MNSFNEKLFCIYFNMNFLLVGLFLFLKASATIHATETHQVLVIFPSSIFSHPIKVRNCPSSYESHKARVHQQIHHLWNECRLQNTSFKVNFIYSALFPGVSLEFQSPYNISLLNESKLIDNFSLVGKATFQSIRKYQPAKNNKDVPKLKTENSFQPAHELTGLLKIPIEDRPTGKGITVGVIDSGIDFHHPAFKDRIQYEHSFVNCNHRIPQDFRNQAFDDMGHGTFVAGIIGGHCEGFSGVAPDVRFGIYKVGCGDNVGEDVVLKAMDQAFHDGVDIISISINKFEFPTSSVLSAIRKTHPQRTIIITAMGNDGPSVMNAGTYASFSDTLAVASVDVQSYKEVQFRFLELETSFPYRIVHIDDENRDHFFTFPWQEAELTSECQLLPSLSIEEKIAFVELKQCSQKKVVNLLQSKMAKGIIFFNSKVRPLISTIPQAEIIGQHDRNIFDPILINNLIPSKGTNEITDSSAPLPSWFNSFGPSMYFKIKPDIMAPGEFVSSTVPRSQGSFSVESGTSFAAPYISGVAALFLEKNSVASFQDFNKVILNNAVPILCGNGIPYSVAIQGAGLVNVPGTLYNKVCVSPPKLELELLQQSHISDITISNTGITHKMYEITQIPANAMRFFNGNNEQLHININLNVSLNNGVTKVSVPATSELNMPLEFRFTPPSIDDCLIISGYIHFEDFDPDESKRQHMNIPYLGLHLSEKASCIKSFNLKYEDNDNEDLGKGPFIQEYSHKGYRKKRFYQENDVIATSLDAEHELKLIIPIYFHVENIAINVIDATQKASLIKKPNISSSNVGSNTEINLANLLQNLPDGQYRVIVTISSLQIGKKTHLETWNSPIIKIDRAIISRIFIQLRDFFSIH